MLVAGGKSGGSTLASAEVFDPAAGKWTNTGAMNLRRNFHTSTLLPSGHVLVTGGYNGNVLASAEIYDPDAGQWTTTGSMNTARGNHTATLLSTGDVLVAGGWSGDISMPGIPDAEIYNHASGVWIPTDPMHVPPAKITPPLHCPAVKYWSQAAPTATEPPTLPNYTILRAEPGRLPAP